MSYPTCPICQNLLIADIIRPYKSSCTNRIITAHDNYSHYVEWRKHDGYRNSTYIIMRIRPFDISWDNGNLYVYKHEHFSPIDGSELILEIKNFPQEDLPKVYHRFKNLRAFL